MFKPITAAILALSTLSAPVSAMTQTERENHWDIVEALEGTGISVYVNEDAICGDPDDRFLGAYIPKARAVVICQENAKVWNGEAIRFSLEDLDTLRHEAHHAVQDCLDGRIDGELSLLFEAPHDKAKFRGMIDSRIEPKVRRVYGSAGANEHVIQLEIEAFGVAAEVGAATIAEAVTNVCSYAM